MKQSPPDDAHRATPFTTPEGYFEKLPTRIQQRVAEDAPSESTPAFFPRWAYYALGAGAMLLVSVWLTNGRKTPSNEASTTTLSVEQRLAQVPDEEIMEYLQTTEVDVMATLPLTEAEQQTLLEQELDAYEITEEYVNDTDDEYLEEFL